jgi:hypothetical protein
MPVSIEKVCYGGWPNCFRISNHEVELITTSDVGPRVIRYGFIGGRNLFKEFPEQMGRTGEADWQPRGGHRIWIAPEIVPDTYAPDNGPVRAIVHDDGVELIQPVEPATCLEKAIRIRLTADGGVVTHRVRNAASRPRTFAPWALSMMAPGGVGIAKFPPRGSHPEHLAPTNPLVMWAFTDLSDPRWTITQRHLILRQDANRAAPQKLGLFNTRTAAAYLLGDDLFVKRYDADPSKPYADFGASFEMFANGSFLELETLGPLETVEPGDAIEHVERWTLHRNIAIDEWTDDELDQVIPLE